MDDSRFDALARALGTARSRRRALGAVLGGPLGLFGLTIAAKKKGKGKRKGKPKKRKDCPKSRPTPCGTTCCTLAETCRKGACVDHCTDGVQNFDETDVDCGGSCRDVKKCQLVQKCAADADCFNTVCTGNLCAECRLDSDCDRLGNPLRFRCFDSFCFECAAGFDCPRPGQGAAQTVCINRRCVECASDADCPTARPFCMTALNEVCVDNAVRPCACRACRDDVDCAAGQVCDDETGSCVECAQDADCTTAGDVCVQNSCRTPATCPAGRDLCTQGFGSSTACGGGASCRCHTTTDAETRCVAALEGRCDSQAACTSRAECEARHGSGAVCVQDTGTFCGCAFCAVQCTV